MEPLAASIGLVYFSRECDCVRSCWSLGANELDFCNFIIILSLAGFLIKAHDSFSGVTNQGRLDLCHCILDRL